MKRQNMCRYDYYNQGVGLSHYSWLFLLLIVLLSWNWSKRV